MLQLILTGLLYLITIILLFCMTDITIVHGIISLLYLIVIASVYVMGYKKGIIDTRNGLKEMVEDELAAYEAELKRLSEGVDSGLL